MAINSMYGDGMTGDDPYAHLTDAQVLELAKKALLQEAELPPGSLERSIQGLKFDAARMELTRRAVRYALARLNGQDAD